MFFALVILFQLLIFYYHINDAPHNIEIHLLLLSSLCLKWRSIVANRI